MQKNLIRFSVLALACTAAMAQDNSPVTQSVQKTIENNPEIAAKFSAFRAAKDEVGVASGAWMPHLDLSADGGKRSYDNSQTLPQSPNFWEAGGRVQLTQLLWDGLGTRNEVDRLGHAKLVRYFEFVDSTEQNGLEAAKAYFDVVRYRKLVVLAEDNYVQHKYSYDQVASRVKAGVGRGVDLEQVLARVALAQSNLVTERANLHDVTERYLRVVGTLPPADNVSTVTMVQQLPATQEEAMTLASRQSPAIAAAIENLRAARSAAASTKSSFQPRVEAHVRGAVGHNLDGVIYEKRDATAEIAMTWNIFNGGTDSARERQYASLLTQAEDLRDKACNDVRQATAIAWNDVRKLREQLGYLDRNVVSIQKARDAYRQQFDIGQRSLLDLLNAENELYTAKHAYVMAEEDLATAIVRTYAGIGTLVANLGLKRPDTLNLAPEAQNWDSDGDGSNHCPLQPVTVGGASFEELDKKADALAASHVPPPAPPTLGTVPAPPVPATPSTPAASPAAAATQRLQDWAAAWTAKDADRYLSFYSAKFKPARTGHDQWVAERKRLLAKPGTISVKVDNVTTRPLAGNRVETSFDQVYTSPDYRDTMHKALVWEREDGDWKIVGESNR